MAAQSVPEQNIPALTPMQRVERLVLAVALVGLILTGLPQRYLGEPWATALVVLGGGIESLRILHRFFALLLLGEGLYHVLALGYRRFVVGRAAALLPGLRDVRALVARVLANLGLGGGAPPYGFVLRFEYLVIVLAVIVLGLTGLALWNPIAVTRVLPSETIPVARSVHSDHALLTVVLLVLLRLGIVLLWRPKRDESAEAATPINPARRGGYLLAAGLVALVAVGGLALFLTSEQTAINTVPRRQAVIFAPQALPDEGDPRIGEVLWGTLRCAFCHGADAQGGTRDEPALRGADLAFTAFYEQVRVGRGEMPAFSDRELPDGYLVHLWAWLMEEAG